MSARSTVQLVVLRCGHVLAIPNLDGPIHPFLEQMKQSLRRPWLIVWEMSCSLEFEGNHGKSTGNHGFYLCSCRDFMYVFPKKNFDMCYL